MIEKYVDTRELRRLISMLIAILGCLIIAALFASIVVPGLRNANRPATPASVAPVIGESGWLNPEEFPPQKGSVIPPVDPKTVIEPTEALITRGKELFQKNCAPCHGPLGRGDGPAASTMNPKPRNLFTADGWKNGADEPGIFKTLSEGIKGTSMAAFDYLSKKDRMAIVHYAQAIGPTPRKRGSAQSMEALANQLASAGEIIPNRIPVSRAMAKLGEEYPPPSPLAVSRDDQSPGARILARIVIDPERSGRFLAQSQSWKPDPKALASVLLLNAPGNGFSVQATLLSESEWREVHAELLKLARIDQ
jgi:mono/diheme cytochrome c family protein